MNKPIFSPILLGIICFLLGWFISRYSLNLEPKTTNSSEPTFIWNDDIESIPMDNSTIILEKTKGDTIYIGPNN